MAWHAVVRLKGLKIDTGFVVLLDLSSAFIPFFMLPLQIILRSLALPMNGSPLIYLAEHNVFF